MGAAVMHNVVSVDGFIADANDDVGALFDWYFNGDTAVSEDSSFRFSQVSADYVRSVWNEVGSMVIGRHLFDIMNGWDGKPPVGDHVVVVSHRPKPHGWHPDASYHFVDDVAEAMARADALADGRTITVAAGDVGGQALQLGHIDEVAMDVVPIVFGSGKRFFGQLGDQCFLEDPHLVIPGTRVLHLRYRVRR